MSVDIENIEHSKTHVAISIDTPGNINTTNTITNTNTTNDIENSTGPKQSFFFAFLHSSIPADVWDNIKGEMWKDHEQLHVEESPLINTPMDTLILNNNTNNNNINSTYNNTIHESHSISIDTYGETESNLDIDMDMDSIKRSGSSVLFEGDDEETHLL